MTRLHTTGLPETGGGVTDHGDLTGLADDDHPQYVERAGMQAAAVEAAESTTATRYVDLATVGPSVTVTVSASGRVLVLVGANLSNSSAAGSAYMGVAVSGATTRAVLDAESLKVGGTTGHKVGNAFVITGLTPGSNTFTAKYGVDAGAGTATAIWRRLTVIPF